MAYNKVSNKNQNKDVKYMKLLKCLCSSATCAQTAQLLSQQVRQARAPLVKCVQQPWRVLGAVLLLRYPVVVAAGPQMAVQGSTCHSQRDGAYKHHCYGRVAQCASTHQPVRRHNIP